MLRLNKLEYWEFNRGTRDLAMTDLKIDISDAAVGPHEYPCGAYSYSYHEAIKVIDNRGTPYCPDCRALVAKEET